MLRGVDDLILLGDNLEILPGFADGAFRMIYLDPPFNTGRERSARPLRAVADADGDRTGFGGRRYRTELLERSSYRDTFDDYLGFLEPRLRHAHRLLDAQGTLYLHLDYREAHYVKILCDEVFGRASFLNEIVWAYDYGGKPRRRWPAKHDTILVYVRDPDRYWFDSDAVEREPYMAPGLVTPEKAARGKLPTDCWWHTIVPTAGRERTGYPTQKPEGIVRRMVQASTQPGDRVADFFAGSGTLGAVAAALGRRYVLIDRNPEAVAIMERRLGATRARALCTPAAVPTTAAPAMPRKKPCSTTPGTARTEAASAAGSDQSSRRQSRIALPSSVTKGRPSAPVRRVGSQPRSRSSRPHTGRANSTTSTGSGATLTQPGDELALVGDDHHQPPGARDDLLAQVGAAEALDQVEAGIDLVGAVDHDIELGRLRERRQRDAEAAAGGGRRVRGGHAGHVAQAAGGDPRGQRLEHHSRRRPRAEAEPHPVADVAPDRLLAGGAPPRVDRAHAAIAARTAAGSVIGARHANRSQM